MRDHGPLVTAAEQRTAIGHNGGPAPDAPARRRGRPSLYTPETVAMISNRLADGESLKAICRCPGSPSECAVLWVATRPEFRRHYDLARQLGTHSIAEDVLEIADGRWSSLEAIKEARRRIDAKKWHLGRMAPKRRGPRPVTGGL